MIRLLSAMTVAILCHSATAWAMEFEDIPEVSPGRLEDALDIIRAAADLGALRTCPTERCLQRKSLAARVGQTAITVIALGTLKHLVTPAYARAYFASYATKSLARVGFATLGLTGGYVVIAIYVSYELTVSAVMPAGSIPLADGIMFDDANRARFLALPRWQIVNMAYHDRLLRHEIVMLAHAVLEAREHAFAQAAAE